MHTSRTVTDNPFSSFKDEITAFLSFTGIFFFLTSWFDSNVMVAILCCFSVYCLSPRTACPMLSSGWSVDRNASPISASRPMTFCSPLKWATGDATVASCRPYSSRWAQWTPKSSPWAPISRPHYTLASCNTCSVGLCCRLAKLKPISVELFLFDTGHMEKGKSASYIHFIMIKFWHDLVETVYRCYTHEQGAAVLFMSLTCVYLWEITDMY